MKQHDYNKENERWFWGLVIVCICIGYILASMFNAQIAGLFEDFSRTTVGNIVRQCDPTADETVFFDQMVLGTSYRTWSDEILNRWVVGAKVPDDFVYPEDLTELSHYTVIMRPNYPSIVELYSYSTNTTWFRIFPDNFNSVNTRACGVYRGD